VCVVCDWSADDDILRSCTSSPTIVPVSRSSVIYIASANYPHRYPIDSHCQWHIVAAAAEPQRRRPLLAALRLTIIDFELDVRRGGRCHDLFTVTASSAAPSRQRASTVLLSNALLLVTTELIMHVD